MKYFPVMLSMLLAAPAWAGTQADKILEDPSKVYTLAQDAKTLSEIRFFAADSVPSPFFNTPPHRELRLMTKQGAVVVYETQAVLKDVQDLATQLNSLIQSQVDDARAAKVAELDAVLAAP